MYLANANAFKGQNIVQLKFVCRVIIHARKKIKTVKESSKEAINRHISFIMVRRQSKISLSTYSPFTLVKIARLPTQVSRAHRLAAVLLHLLSSTVVHTTFLSTPTKILQLPTQVHCYSCNSVTQIELQVLLLLLDVDDDDGLQYSGVLGGGCRVQYFFAVCSTVNAECC